LRPKERRNSLGGLKEKEKVDGNGMSGTKLVLRRIIRCTGGLVEEALWPTIVETPWAKFFKPSNRFRNIVSEAPICFCAFTIAKYQASC
jgi:hypothetical protein